MPGQWLVNGQPDPRVRADDRGFAYGDGLFETIAWRRGQPRFLDRHLQRLLDGSRRLGLPVPDTSQLVAEMLRLGGTEASGTLRVTVSRGPAPRGYAPPQAPEPSRVLGFFAGAGAPVDRPLVVGLCRTPASSNAALAGMKTLNRLDNVLASAEAARRGLDEGIMCTASGRVVGATAANVFAVSAGVLVTPDLVEAGVAGVMRGVVLDCARELGLPVREAPLDIDALLGAEELFLTNALTGLRPVAAIEGRALTGRALTRRLVACLHERGVPEALAC